MSKKILKNRYLTEYDEIYTTDGKSYESVGGLEEGTDLSHMSVKEVIKDIIQPEDKLPTVKTSSAAFDIDNKRYIIRNYYPDNYTYYLSKGDNTDKWYTSFGLTNISIDFEIEYYEHKLVDFYVTVNDVKSVNLIQYFQIDKNGNTQSITNKLISDAIEDESGNPILSNIAKKIKSTEPNHDGSITYLPDNTRCTECNFKIIGILDNDEEITIYDRSIYFVIPILLLIDSEEPTNLNSSDFFDSAKEINSKEDIGTTISCTFGPNDYQKVAYVAIPKYDDDGPYKKKIIMDNDGDKYNWYKYVSIYNYQTEIEYDVYRSEVITNPSIPDYTFSICYTIDKFGEYDQDHVNESVYRNNRIDIYGGFMLNTNQPLDDRSVVINTDDLETISNRAYNGMITYVDNENATYICEDKYNSKWNKILTNNMSLLLNGGKA